ncbi:MAG: SIS domain-containing protein [Acidimicrobiales bacterium]
MSPESTDFLYPFIEGDERDVAALLRDLSASASAKATESAQLRSSTLESVAGELERAAQAMAERFEAGARLYTFGNGGSATDAASVAALFAQAPAGVSFPARCLVTDQAVLTAIGNDVGYELTFSRQLIAFASAVDVAMGFSTSGNSENVIRAFEEAKRRGLLTVGFAGYEGGQMAACEALDHCFIVRSHSVHRIQETQAALSYRLWAAVRERASTDNGALAAEEAS